MAILIKLDTLEYPISVGEFKERHPQVMFPVQINFAAYGYDVVFPAPPPAAPSILKRYSEIAPVLTTKGTWEQAWELVDVYADIPGGATKAQQEADAVAAATLAATNLFIASVTSAVQDSLDVFARTRNYDGILSACTYASSTVASFKAEGQYCVDARDAAWNSLYTLMAQVQAGTAPMPTSVAAVLATLPVLTWP